MPEIKLNNGAVTAIDDEDADLVQFNWTALYGNNGLVYAYRRGSAVNGKSPVFYLHRVILSRILKRDLQRHELTDHIDLNPLNNCRSNLRVSSAAENAANSRLRSDNSTGFKGVYATGYKDPLKQFKAQCGGVVLGSFPTAEEAHAAYCKAAVERYGEFAKHTPATSPVRNGVANGR